jgi:hypothetical protein
MKEWIKAGFMASSLMVIAGIGAVFGAMLSIEIFRVFM